MLKFYVKGFRTSLFLNSVVYLFHVWHDDRCWSIILCSTIPNPVYDFKVKVTDLEFLYCNFFTISVLFCFLFVFLFFFRKAFYGFIHLRRDDRALSKILHSTIPIQVQGLKVKDFFMLNFYSVIFCKAFD